MKTFKTWLEDRQSNLKDTVLQLLGLDDEGLETPLESLNVETLATKLVSLGVWKTIPPEIQTALLTTIKNKVGTVGQLIDKMAERKDNFDTSMMPSVEEI